ncbi:MULTISPECIES: PPC domain-containing protein [unclassified Pseudoalteromonas]|uniref:PPC domain-containing protein n=1 Tax=unclassified Pseudoalteromonas TaxID=194690 RepID=UPI0005A6D0A1|nr:MULTISPECIES: PPC domain-containing protein [unclassified Pseudoalteromonas]
MIKSKLTKNLTLLSLSVISSLALANNELSLLAEINDQKSTQLTIDTQVAQLNSISTLSAPYVGQMNKTLSANSWKYYYIKVPKGRKSLSIDISHLSGDLNLYLRKGIKPSDGVYDSSSNNLATNADAVSVTTQDNERWYIGIHNTTDRSQNYKLTLVLRDNSIAGWSSDTHFRKADTILRENITSRATRAIGQSSGSSTLNSASDVYYTDVFGGDGSRMRSAMSIFVNSGKSASVTTKENMRTALTGSGYSYQTVTLLINKIIDVFTDSSTTVPTTEQATLDILNIRKQCLEWVVSVVTDSGGNKSVGYILEEQDKQLARPGMGFYKNNRGHSAIIIDVKSDETGKVTDVKLASANNGSGWTKPIGEVAWSRMVSQNNLSLNDWQYKLVDLSQN